MWNICEKCHNLFCEKNVFPFMFLFLVTYIFLSDDQLRTLSYLKGQGMSQSQIRAYEGDNKGMKDQILNYIRQKQYV